MQEQVLGRKVRSFECIELPCELREEIPSIQVNRFIIVAIQVLGYIPEAGFSFILSYWLVFA